MVAVYRQAWRGVCVLSVGSVKFGKSHYSRGLGAVLALDASHTSSSTGTPSSAVAVKKLA
jgi:hypothetical protein